MKHYLQRLLFSANSEKTLPRKLLLNRIIIGILFGLLFLIGGYFAGKTLYYITH